MPASERRTPDGYVGMTDAKRITGYSREWITKAAGRGEIPGAFQRLRKSPWFFTVEGLQSWMRGETQPQRVAS